MAVPVFTWAAKSAAAAACAVAVARLTWMGAMLTARGPRFMAFWFAVFFSGGGASAAIGAVLEAAYDDLQTGPLWLAMLVFVEIAAYGAWVTGALLLATSLGGAEDGHDNNLSRAVVRFAAWSGFVATIAVVAVTWGDFDTAMEAAMYGGVSLLVG